MGGIKRQNPLGGLGGLKNSLINKKPGGLAS